MRPKSELHYHPFDCHARCVRVLRWRLGERVPGGLVLQRVAKIVQHLKTQCIPRDVAFGSTGVLDTERNPLRRLVGARLDELLGGVRERGLRAADQAGAPLVEVVLDVLQKCPECDLPQGTCGHVWE